MEENKELENFYRKKFKKEREDYANDLKKAEKDAEKVLLKLGFENIFRFNKIWFLRANNPIYNYYAEKKGRKWLFKIKIGKAFGKKKHSDNYSKSKGYNIAVLRNTGGKKWTLVQIEEQENESKEIKVVRKIYKQ